jgi:hypothetical protein
MKNIITSAPAIYLLLIVGLLFVMAKACNAELCYIKVWNLPTKYSGIKGSQPETGDIISITLKGNSKPAATSAFAIFIMDLTKEEQAEYRKSKYDNSGNIVAFRKYKITELKSLSLDKPGLKSGVYNKDLVKNKMKEKDKIDSDKWDTEKEEYEKSK